MSPLRSAYFGSSDRNSFFDEVIRIAGPNYIPVEADVLRARTKTTGIYETRFTMGQLSIQYAASFRTLLSPGPPLVPHLARLNDSILT